MGNDYQDLLSKYMKYPLTEEEILKNAQMQEQLRKEKEATKQEDAAQLLARTNKNRDDIQQKQKEFEDWLKLQDLLDAQEQKKGSN
jgi:uncharacterized protein YoxC